MTLEPTKNRYVRYMRSIRAIQDYLISRAQRHAVPAVNNTNVDRSVATIHATTLGCLRRQARVRSGPSIDWCSGIAALLKHARGKVLGAAPQGLSMHCKHRSWTGSRGGEWFCHLPTMRVMCPG